MNKSVTASSWLKGAAVSLCAFACLSGAAVPAAANSESLSADYAKRILNIYNAHNTEDDLPDVAARVKGRGIRQGQFWVLPEVESGLLIDSNVLATPRGTVDDEAFFITPNIKIKSDFGRHEVAAEAAVKHVEYFSRSPESRTEAFGKVQSRIDITRDLNAYLTAKGGVFREERGAIVAPTATMSPIEYQRFDLAGKLEKTFNRLKVSGGVAYAMFDYNDGRTFAGANLDQDFRDSNRVEAGGRLSYNFSPGYSLFGDFRFTHRDYDGPAATNRSSNGFRTLGGVEFELGRLLRGEVGVGYNHVDYTSAVFGQNSALSFLASLVWNPTPLMTFNFDARQRFEDTTIPGLSGSDQSYFRLSLDYEVLRRLIVSPHLRFVYDSFNSSSVKGYTLGAGLRAEYEINRYLGVGVDYLYTDRDFTGLALDFERHQAGLFLKARF
ncbi:MAG: outer membrane beta-barrel protein [Alphaproteobacteria bacterium]|nr:outer membrane beta-barrel protein [Alphaproteobacteria bacterium]